LRAAAVKGDGVGQPGVTDYVVNVKKYASAAVSLRAGDMYVFGANRLHQVSPVKGPLARVTLGAFISFDRDKNDVLVWV
jgi:predicted 2-oxoglutarate/Fe(II)-dependent dioxygenase YbiX